MKGNKNGFKKEDTTYKKREEQESKEGLPSEEIKAPADKFQTRQQEQPAAAAMDTKTPKGNGYSLHTDEVPSQVINTSKVAEVIKDAPMGIGSGSSGGSSFGLRMAPSYSGKDETISGDMSSTPTLDKSDRKDSRTGKKLDSTLKHINYFINEQVKVDYKESKPLAESPSEVQGYNGSYKNEHARTQKNNGGVPADLYFDRSIDEIHMDNIYPIFGQYISDGSAPDLREYPEKTYVGDDNEEADSDGYIDYSINHRSNYVPRSLVVKINSTGLTDFNFTDEEIGNRECNAEVANMASQHAYIDANQAEIDRQTMDSKAGDEKSDGWSPIPRSVAEPTRLVTLLRDIDASTGAEVFMAYKKTAACMSYQLNKVAKDGQRITSPMVEMMEGVTADDVSDLLFSLSDESAPSGTIFSSTKYAAGSAALMIALFDSVAKYSTKGDILLQPRSIRLHLQTADNNMNILNVPKQFVKTVQANECFSTIGKYDPFLPVLISDKVALAHPLSFTDFISKTDGIVDHNQYSYMYKNRSNNRYVVDVNHPLVEGVYTFMNTYASKLYSLLPKTDGVATLTIPCIHSTTSFSLWSLILLASVPFMIKSRIPSFVDVIDYTRRNEYPFSQLIDMKTANPMYAENYINGDYNEPLVSKELPIEKAIRWIMPETFWQVDEEADGWQVVLPYYFNETQFEYDSENEVSILSDRPASMSYPSVRSGTRLLVLENLYNMTERQLRLCLDRMVVPPCFETTSSSGTTYNLGDYSIYKYGINTDGIPCFKYSNTDTDANYLSLGKLLSTPRELGLVIPCPNGGLSKVVTAFTSSSSYTTKRIDWDADNLCDIGLGLFRVRCWKNDNDEINNDFGVTNSILGSNAVNVSRAASLKQSYYFIIAQRLVGNLDYDLGFLPSFAQLFKPQTSGAIVADNKSAFIPFVDSSNKPLDSTDFKVISLQKAVWFRLQRFPIAVNPFDAINKKLGTGVEDGNKVDPYDFLYYLGLAGFRASDYNEDIYNREKFRLNAGMLFISDPFINDSAIFHI